MTANGEQKSSRRRFLKTSALTGAGGVAAAAAWNGVSPYMLREEMVFDLNQSYWAKALPAPNPPLQENIDAEVVIIGGGLCGLSTAYYLKKGWRNESTCSGARGGAVRQRCFGQKWRNDVDHDC